MQRQDAVKLVQKYNKEPFHMQHAFTVEAVMRWFANELGYGSEADFWALAGLLHDVDFEMWPDEHCKKAPELLAEIGADEALVHAVCSHGWGDGKGAVCHRRIDGPDWRGCAHAPVEKL